MENHKGIKYKLYFLRKGKPRDKRINELIKWCELFHQHGLTPSYNGGSYGNLSFRVHNNEFMITGSQLELKTNLTPISFVKIKKCDLDNRKVYAEGKIKPSSETLLHFMIYTNRPDVNAVFHGHDSIILSKATRLKVPQTPREERYGSAKLISQVKKLLNKEQFLIMKNHGFLSLGRTMTDAGVRALTFHKKASLLEKYN